MIYTTDDLCLSHLDKFKYFDIMKVKYPSFRLIAFAIANKDNNELLLKFNVS
jgi:hypothetical protein